MQMLQIAPSLYFNVMERLSTNNELDALRVFIDDSAHAVFVVDTQSEEICLANKIAVQGCGGGNPIGWPVSTFVHIPEDSANTGLAYFDNQWQLISEKSFEIQGRSLIKVTIREHPAVPPREAMHASQKIIALLLHRFNSPLTGLQGYLGLMMGDEHEAGRNSRHIGKMREGIGSLMSIMQELELLYSIGDEPTTVNNLTEEHLSDLIGEVVSDYSDVARKRIRLMSGRLGQTVNTQPSRLKGIISFLLDNALEHGNDPDDIVIVDTDCPNCIRVTNFGRPIPESTVAQLFHPFVTTKSQSMGVGLSIVSLLARQIGATVMLTSNTAENGITFSVYLPPDAY
jgi:signal transduction histidine kinase